MEVILVLIFVLKNRYNATLKQKSSGSYFLSVVDVWWKSWEPQKLNVGSCEISFYSLTIGFKSKPKQLAQYCSYLTCHCWKSVIKMNHLCPDIIHVVYNLHAYKKIKSIYTENETKGKGNISTALDSLSLTLLRKKLLINVMGVTWALRGVFMKIFLQLNSC